MIESKNFVVLPRVSLFLIRATGDDTRRGKLPRCEACSNGWTTPASLTSIDPPPVGEQSVGEPRHGINCIRRAATT